MLLQRGTVYIGIVLVKFTRVGLESCRVILHWGRIYYVPAALNIHIHLCSVDLSKMTISITRIDGIRAVL